MNREREFLSPREAGEMLGVSEYTIKTWIRKGHLRAYKSPAGGRVMIRQSDLLGCLVPMDANAGD